MSKPHVIEQLLEPLKQPMATDQILAVQFRALVRGVEMTPEKWEALMDRFMARHPMKHLMDPDMEKLERSNFERALLQPTLSWRMFCQGLEFLNVSHACLFVNIMTHDGASASSAMNVGFSK